LKYPFLFPLQGETPSTLGKFYPDCMCRTRHSILISFLAITNLRRLKYLSSVVALFINPIKTPPMHIGAICSRETIIASPADSIQTASQQMLQYNVGSLVLVETDAKGNKPVGIVTDRDIVLKVIAPELKISEVKLADIMSTKLLTAKETDDVYETLKKMRAKVVRRIPVVDEEGYLKGMLTIDDLLEFFNKEMGEVVSLFKKEQGR